MPHRFPVGRVGATAMTRTLLAVLAALLPAPASAQARAGQADTHFATRGTQTLNARGADAVGGAVMVLPRGRMLAGGAAAGKLLVLRLHSTSGKLDNDFGDRGQFVPELPGTTLDGVRALARFRDGRIVAAGTLNVNGGASRMAGARLLPNREVDPSFGAGRGYVLAGPAGSVLGAMSMDSSGNIVLAGARTNGDGSETPLIARLLPDGTPDTAFATGGVLDGATLGLTNRATAVLARPDGTIVLAIGAAPGHTGPATFQVVRLLVTGAPDPGFGAGGIVNVVLGAGRGDGVGADALNIGPSGTLLVGGTGLSDRGSQQANVIRLRPGGALDKRFPTRGDARVARARRNLRVNSIARDAVGRILIAGTARAPGSLVARLRPGGRRDTRFGTHGVTFPALGLPGGGTPVYSTIAAVDSVGTHAVLAGTAAGPGELIRTGSGTTYHGHFVLTVARLH